MEVRNTLQPTTTKLATYVWLYSHRCRRSPTS